MCSSDLFDLSTAEGRVSALKAAAPMVAKIRDASLRPEYARSLAGWLGMEVDSVIDVVKKSGGRTQSSVNQSNPPENIAAATWRPDPNEPRLALEREVLKARLQMPALVYQWREIETNAFSHPAYQRLRTFIDSHPEIGRAHV